MSNRHGGRVNGEIPVSTDQKISIRFIHGRTHVDQHDSLGSQRSRVVEKIVDESVIMFLCTLPGIVMFGSQTLGEKEALLSHRPSIA